MRVYKAGLGECYQNRAEPQAWICSTNMALFVPAVNQSRAEVRAIISQFSVQSSVSLDNNNTSSEVCGSCQKDPCRKSKLNYFRVQIPIGASSFEVGSRSQRAQGGGRDDGSLWWAHSLVVAGSMALSWDNAGQQCTHTAWQHEESIYKSGLAMPSSMLTFLPFSEYTFCYLGTGETNHLPHCIYNDLQARYQASRDWCLC